MAIRGVDVKVVRIADSRSRHVQLPVIETGAVQVKADRLECLALRFVNCEGKTGLDGELNAAEGNLDVRRNEGNSRDEHRLLRIGSSNDCALDHIRQKLFHDQASPIDHLGRVQVSQKHDRLADFELKSVRREARWLSGIDELGGVVNGELLLH